ncbi:HAD superfamily hydrolase [Grosmannia clavigera kw1407]|uniref:HAD superfamily hydrolase n=1 Tax=Grosmannia clavigera (strain kw1407 / UAMH 11150) TaxID=655863 RepID=F0XM42_GROCL|nr:HAD superfamily hydrolase [Grosmannia clavigera kw1407]EFX01196.1 HAD superfamily hydrolase [Grosmannia clavigera kw1407]
MAVKTYLFDCDNTLVLSEELAFEGCADLLNEICAAKGVSPPPSFTGGKLITEFVGQNFRGMLASLQQRYGFPLAADEADGYVVREEDVVIARLRSGLAPCVGVETQLKRLQQAPERPTLAVVSSSALRRLRASLETVGFDRFFAADQVYSAATSLPTPTSKPDPAVYLHALEQLGAQAASSVAVEDSRSGTLSAVRAGIPVIGYVGPYPADRQDSMAAVLREAGARVVIRHWDEFPQAVAEIEAA